MKRLCIHNIRLIDGLGGEFPSADVFVEEGGIRDVRIPSAVPPANCESISGLQRILMPGLIDGHVHLLFDASPRAPLAMLHKSQEQLVQEALERARIILATGVTAIRELSGTAKAMFSLKSALTNFPDAPRIYDCYTPLTSLGGFGREVCLELTRANAAEIIQSLAGKADLVKVLGDRYDSGSSDGFRQHFDDDLFELICRSCREVGLRLDVHAKSRATIRQCLKFGVNSIEHGIHADAEDLQEMAQQGVYLNATFLGLRCRSDNQPDFDEFARVMGFYPLARDSGVPLTLGSDSGAIFTPHDGAVQEIEYMVQAGLSPQQAIIAATSRNAQRCGDNTIGAVEIGRKADLILLDENPLTDITAIRRTLRWVMKGGEILHHVGADN